MKKTIFLNLAVFFLMAMVCTTFAVANAVEISVSTDKSYYSIGEDVTVLLTAFNPTDSEVTLTFGSSCQAKYYMDGQFDYMHDKLCAMVITQVVIRPNDSYTWTMVHDSHERDYYPLLSGKHFVVGEVIGYGLSEPAEFEVGAITIYVSTTGSDETGDGSSENPFATIQKAIDSAFNGDTVIVADGTYTGPGNRDISFRGKAITVRSQNGPENCIIDCNSTWGHRVFYFRNGEDGNSVLDGFTITNGYAFYGGGILCSRSSPTITNCTISDNRAFNNGGGICCWESNATITNCTISGNSTTLGGGGGIWGSNATITNCILWDNWPQQIDGSGSVTYSNVQGGWEGEGNIDADPCFAFSTDYHLTAVSPCIDDGTNTPITGLSTTDIDGNPRLSDGDEDGSSIVDMGAYEYNPNSPLLAVSLLSFYFAQLSSELASQTLFIRNCGGQLLQWEIVEDCSWLEVAPANGVSTDQINEVTITVDPNGLEVGDYSCLFIVHDSNAVKSPKTVSVALSVLGTVVHVPNQLSTIQDAIDHTLEGGIVIVADGTYTGFGNKNIDFRGKAITVRSESGPENCIIDCENSGRGFQFRRREDENSVLDGFTITNSYTRYDYGGGISCEFSSPTITNCTIRSNSADRGGGILCYYDSSPTITNCIISGNSAGSGGGIYCLESNPTITNCTITGNSAKVNGGGIYCCYRSNLTIANCIFWGNADSSGQGQSAQIYGETETPGVWFSCIQDDNPDDANVPFGTEKFNIDDDPCFVEPGYWDANGLWLDGDYHLLADSPCIETGNPYFTYHPGDVDMDAQPRIMGLRVDIGADEFEIAVIVVTKPQGGEVWTGGSTHKIEWSSYGAGAVGILFSTDAGSSWQTIESGASDTESYTWQISNKIQSEQCLVSVVPSVPDPDVVCIGSGLFTIQSYHGPQGVPQGRKGRLEKFGPELGCVKWQFQTDGPVTAGVTLDRHIGRNNRAYIVCEDGKLYTLNAADGSLIWSYDTNSPLVSSAAVNHYGTVYVGSTEGKLYAIDKNGVLLWTHTTNGPIYSSPAVSTDGRTYVCSLDGMLYALGRDGSELWSFETTGFAALNGSIFASPPIGPDGTVYTAGLYDPNLYALDSNNGSVKWNCTFLDPCDPNSEKPWPFASPVIAQDGTIYQTLLYDGNLYAIGPDTGAIIWSTDLADPCSSWFEPNDSLTLPFSDGWSSPVLAPDGTIYVSFDDPYLRAVDTNGSIEWVTKLGTMGGFTLTVGDDGLVYAASDDGRLYVVNPEGEEIARFQSNDWLSFPVIAPDKTIIVSDANNMVWAISEEDCDGKPPVLDSPEQPEPIEPSTNQLSSKGKNKN